MRFFIFPYENIYIAVAADMVKRFISLDAPDNFHDTGKKELPETDQIKIPVCMIFKKLHEDKSSRHGIVLKQETAASGVFGDKTIVIITPPVERDIEVAENKIQKLPGSFTGVYSTFSGLYFNEPVVKPTRQLKEQNGETSGSDKKIIFFLDIEKFISMWQKRSEHELQAERQVSG